MNQGGKFLMNKFTVIILILDDFYTKVVALMNCRGHFASIMV